MREKLRDILDQEYHKLDDLLKLLEEQHLGIMKNDFFGLDAVVEKIQLCNKEIAEEEVKRRKLVGDNSMKDLINDIGDEELDNKYREIMRLLEELKLQKETNEVLIKQGLAYSTKMLNYINPHRGLNTYNSYGKVKR